MLALEGERGLTRNKQVSEASRTFRWIGAAIFTVLVPGTVTVFLPYYFLDQSVQGIGAWGPIELAAVLVLGVGAAIYFRCLWDFVVAGRGLPGRGTAIVVIAVRVPITGRANIKTCTVKTGVAS